MQTIPFDPPKLAKARRAPGFVDIPETPTSSESPLGWSQSSLDFDPSTVAGAEDGHPPPRLAGPSFLKRSSTMAGNIIMFEDEGKETKAFWLQRKVSKTTYGSIRIGFLLQRHVAMDDDDEITSNVWELVPSEDDPGSFQMVAINIMESGVLELNNVGSFSHNPLHEISALQMIARYRENKKEPVHVVGTDLVAVGQADVYVIMPYHRDGTLFQYCLAQGSLSEPVARFFFRQILEGLQTLKDVGLCHRNLSLETVAMNGKQIDISRLGWALRVSSVEDGQSPTAGEPSNGPSPALVGGSNPQYIAPEVFSNDSVWDGHVADLWACGLMLYSMVVSSQALFVAPIAEDRVFSELCVKGNVRGHAEMFGKMTRNEPLILSSDLSDLLQKMLRVNPRERLSLEEVKTHPWVKDFDAEVPPMLNFSI